MEKVRGIFSSYPSVIAVYLFGSFLESLENAQDADIAILAEPSEDATELYPRLYEELSRVFSPKEVDILFLHRVSLPLAFETIRTGRILYARDDERRRDFEDSIVRKYLGYLHHLRKAERELFETVMEEM